MIGCGDSDSAIPTGSSATVTSTLVSSCTPQREFDTCVEIDLSEVETWQNTLPNPDWRTIETSPEPNADYNIFIDVRELNGGVIPTHPKQGVYENFQHYLDTYNGLIGVDVRNHNVTVHITGSTVKLGKDGGPTASTGVFLYDALSTDRGEIIIDGVDRSRELINPNRVRHFEQDIDWSNFPAGQSSEAHSYEDSSLSSFNTLANNDPWFLEVVDEKLLQDGDWRVTLRMSYRDSQLIGAKDLVPGKVTTELIDLGRNINGYLLTCRNIWIPRSGGFWSGAIQLHCITAEQLRPRLEVAEPDHVMVEEDPAIRANSETIYHIWFDQWGTNPGREACGTAWVVFDMSGARDHGMVETPDVDYADCWWLIPPQ